MSCEHAMQGIRSLTVVRVKHASDEEGRKWVTAFFRVVANNSFRLFQGLDAFACARPRASTCSLAGRTTAQADQLLVGHVQHVRSGSVELGGAVVVEKAVALQLDISDLRVCHG